MSEVYNPMYPTASRLKSKGALKCFQERGGASLTGRVTEAVMGQGALPTHIELLAGLSTGETAHREGSQGCGVVLQ
eukprot:7325676-Pyramimonas_sp.AAC.1